MLFCSCVFKPFKHGDYLARGRERVYLSAFRTIVRFVLVGLCLFPLSLRGWEALRLVIVAVPYFDIKR